MLHHPSPAPSDDAESSPPSSSGRTFRGRARRPPLSRAEEAALGERILEGERTLLSVILQLEAGVEALGRVRHELAAGTLALSQVIRNVEAGENAAREQEERLVAAMSVVGFLRFRELAAVRLHPEALERLLAAAARELDDDAALRARVRAARAKIKSAKDALFEHNAALVVTLAMRYRPRHLAVTDLVQEGNLGLLHAIGKFDHKKGFRLSTYAGFWVKQVIKRAIAEQSPTIRVPVHVADSRTRIRKARAAFEREEQHAPSPSELAARSGVPVQKVELILNLAAEPASLDAALTADGSVTFAELVANRSSPHPEELAATSQLRERARELLGVLNERERAILKLRYGIDGEAEKTLEEIGQVLSITRERVRQIECVALQKLRTRCDAQDFRPDIGA